MMFTSVEYVMNGVALDWADVLWAYTGGFIGWRMPIDIANFRLDRGLLENDLEIELAAVGKDNDFMVRQLLEELARGDCQSEERSMRKWLFLAVKRAYENRDLMSDPYAVIDEIYADFGYPDEIRHLTTFMPAADNYVPHLYTAEENRIHALRNWPAYLENAPNTFAE